MPLNIGVDEPTAIKIGAANVTAVYVGDTQVWPSGFTPEAWATHWYDAWTGAAAGSGQAHIIAFGDSITQGFKVDVPMYDNSWPAQVATLLAAETGYTPGTGYVMAHLDANATANLAPFSEDRITKGGTAADLSSRGTYSNQGGGVIIAKGDGTITFTATGRYFRIYISRESNSANFTYTVDGGSPVSSGKGSGTTALDHLDIDAGTDASHTIVLAGVGSTYIYCHGLEAIRNSTHGVKMSNFGLSGRRCDQVLNASTLASSLYAISYPDTDLIIVAYGVNEAVQAYSTTTFKTNLTTLVDRFQSVHGASVVMMVPPPPSTATVATATWETYVTAIQEVATAEGCGLVDITARWGTYAASSAFYHDNIHPNQSGAADIAAAVSTYLLAAVGV